MKGLVILIGVLFICFNLFFVSASSNQTIFNFLNNTKANPLQYIVVGNSTNSAEIAAAAELAGTFGVTNSRLDSEISLRENLIIIGNPNVNSLAKELIREWKFTTGETLVETFPVRNGYVLVIAGTNSNDTHNTMKLINEFENHSSDLSHSSIKIYNNTITSFDSTTSDKPAVNPIGGSGSGGGGGGGSSSSTISKNNSSPNTTANSGNSVVNISLNANKSNLSEQNKLANTNTKETPNPKNLIYYIIGIIIIMAVIFLISLKLKKSKKPRRKAK